MPQLRLANKQEKEWVSLPWGTVVILSGHGFNRPANPSRARQQAVKLAGGGKFSAIPYGELLRLCMICWAAAIRLAASAGVSLIPCKALT